MNKKDEKELQALKDRLDEVRQERDEESTLLVAIKRKEYEMKEDELDELRKQALPFLEAEEKLFKEVINQVERLSQTLDEMKEVQTEIMSRRTHSKYRIPAVLKTSVRSAMSHFKERFPEMLGLPPRMTRKKRQVEGARDRLKYLEERLKETKKKNLETHHKYEREVVEAEGRVRNARARLELLTQ